MTISLRTFTTCIGTIAAGMFLAACGDTTTAPAKSDAAAGPAATFDFKPGCTGNSGGLCEMTSTVLLSADGDALLYIWSGTYNASTGEHLASGKIERIQAKILNESGKEVAIYNWDGASSPSFVQLIPKSVYRNSSHKIGLQVNIADAAGKTGNSVIRDEIGVAGFLPDLVAGPLQLVQHGVAGPLAPIGVGTTNTYSVAVSNSTGIGGSAPATGAAYVCVVAIDGVTQVAGVAGFQWVGSAARYVGPGAVGSCEFSVAGLALGNRVVTVTAVAQAPFIDANPANNVATGTVRVLGPPDVGMVSIARRVTGGADVVGPQLGQVAPNSTHEYVAWAEVPAGSLPATATCSVTVPGSPEIVWLNQIVTVAPGVPQACRFTLKLAIAGDYPITVTATSAGDPNPTNNTISGSVTVVNPVATNKFVDLIVRSITPIAPIVSGATVTYTAKVGALATIGTTETSAPFACSVAVTRITGGATDPATAGKVELVMTGIATTTVDGQCTFMLTPPAGVSLESYRIAVTATPTTVTELASATANNTLSAVQEVTPRAADVTVRAISRVNGGGSFAPLGEVVADVSTKYSATIGVISSNFSGTVPVTCSVRIVNTRTGVATNLTGTISGLASTTSDAQCEFTTALESNGDLDERYTILVSAAPGTGITDPVSTNNLASGTQTAVVRVDVAATSIQMVVDGVVQATTDPILRGKTANYTATFANGGVRSATVTCVAEAYNASTNVWVSVPLADASATRTIGAGGTDLCRFDYTFNLFKAVTFRVTAVPVSPQDSNLANNSITFVTTPKGDGTFPSVDLANVYATETRFSPLGQLAQPTNLVNPQTLAIRRLSLIFTDSTPNIGTFVLRVKSRSGATAFSEGVLTVPALLAGSDIPACVFGRTTLPGSLDSFTAVNGHKVSLGICAQAVAGSPGLQAILVEFETALIGDLAVLPTTALLESAVTFDVTLDWRLFGSTVWDQASASLQFALRDTDLGFGLYVKNQTGEVTIIRNGPSPLP